jgi:hypothetical protein
MRPDEFKRQLRERLDALGRAPRAELLHVLLHRSELRPVEVRRAGLEPATRCLEGSRSVQTELPALDLHVCCPRFSHIGYSAAASGQDG